jgi:hypothetical protein
MSLLNGHSRFPEPPESRIIFNSHFLLIKNSDEFGIAMQQSVFLSKIRTVSVYPVICYSQSDLIPIYQFHFQYEYSRHILLYSITFINRFRLFIA